MKLPIAALLVSFVCSAPVSAGSSLGSASPHDPVAKAHDLGHAMRKGASSAEQYRLRGQAFAEAGNLEAALADFAQGLLLDPHSHSLQFARGATLVRFGRLQAALPDLRAYLDSHPENGQALWLLGLVQRDLCQAELARVSWEAAWPLMRVRTVQRYIDRSRLLSTLGEVDAALNLIQSGLMERGFVAGLLETGGGIASEHQLYAVAAGYWQALAGNVLRPEPWLQRMRQNRALAGGKIQPLLIQVPFTATRVNPFGASGQQNGQPLDPSFELIPLGAKWSFWDKGTDQGTAWRALSFDDSTWTVGLAELGYGDGDEATEVSFGPDENNKYVTTYFRRKFELPAGGPLDSVWMELRRDDGAVVYLNDVEVARSNMPGGLIASTTLALNTIASFEERLMERIEIDPNLLQVGSNIIAVEVHQRSFASTDLSFDLGLQASRRLHVTRGPYLQQGTQSSVVLRWRTSKPTSSAVYLGDQVANVALYQQSGALTTEHEVEVNGLQPGTRYFYTVGHQVAPLLAANPELYFETSPLASSTDPVRIWAIGDSGTADANARSVFDAYRADSNGLHTDVWLMLGDNAYRSGTDREYQAAVFDLYPELLSNTILWSTLGNHDAFAASSAGETGVYYDIFTLPKLGEAGGLPSGTEAYYSFDHGPVHFVCLDSQDSSLAPGGAMLSWVAADLAAHDREWVIAFWHHPPYTKGTHNSDVDWDSDGRMINVRENLLPVLEAAGVDLVLTGHSHSYERSYLMDGHYGKSDTLLPSMILDDGNGSTDGAYEKASSGSAPNEGVVYTVAGSSGTVGFGALNHPAMVVSLARLGSVIIDVVGDTVTVRFLDEFGAVLDTYSLIKG